MTIFKKNTTAFNVTGIIDAWVSLTHNKQDEDNSINGEQRALVSI